MIGRACVAVGSTFLMVAGAFALVRAAAAQQIVEATCSAELVRGTPNYQSSAEFAIPNTTGSSSSPIDITVGCGATRGRYRIDLDGSDITIRSDLTTSAFYTRFEPWLRLQAGPKGAVVLNPSGGCTLGGAMSFPWYPGSSVTLAPNETFVIDRYQQVSGTMNSVCGLMVTEGAIVGTGISGNGYEIGGWIRCTGSRPWVISSPDLPSFICDGPLPACPNYGASYFSIVTTPGGIVGSANAGPSPHSVDFASLFRLDSPALVYYEVEGGAYCDGLPKLDGQLLPRPSTVAPCLVFKGFLNVGAGWHTIAAREWDSGDGSFTLTVVGAPEPDCNCNGLPDIAEIFWYDEYGYPAGGPDPDANNDGVLDSCGVIGDLNGSGGIDGADLAILLANWGQEKGAGDIDCSGSVDAVDLTLLLDRWSAN